MPEECIVGPDGECVEDVQARLAPAAHEAAATAAAVETAEKAEEEEGEYMLALIDFGLIARVREEDRDAMVSALVHLANRDYGKLIDDFIGLEVRHDDVPHHDWHHSNFTGLEGRSIAQHTPSQTEDPLMTDPPTARHNIRHTPPPRSLLLSCAITRNTRNGAVRGMELSVPPRLAHSEPPTTISSTRLLVRRWFVLLVVG